MDRVQGRISDPYPAPKEPEKYAGNGSDPRTDGPKVGLGERTLRASLVSRFVTHELAAIVHRLELYLAW